MVSLQAMRSGKPVATSMPLSSGDAGVEQTIRQMRKLIEQGMRDPEIRSLVASILHEAAVANFDFTGEARACYNWVLRNIRFTRDVYGVETLASARNIARWGIGDCDDFTVLLCSLLGAIGHRMHIVTISKAGDEGNFSHVFPEDCLNGQWTPLDAARMHPAFGKGPEHADRVRVWAISSDDHQDVRGQLNGLYGPAGRAPQALPGAYPPYVADPRYRNLRGHTLRGVGHYGRREVRRSLRGMRGMGDDSFDWSTFENQLPSLITAGTVGATNIISATRASPYNLFPTTSVAQTSTPIQRQIAPVPVSSFGGLSSNTLLILLGVGAVALIAGERR